MSISISVKNWFVATEQNSFHPHLIGKRSLSLLLIAIIAVQFSANLIIGKPSVLGFATDINQTKVYQLINEQRGKNNLNPLSENIQLDLAAKQKAQDMMAQNYWNHYSPSGGTPWQFITQNGYQYDYAGENLAKDFNTSQGVVAGWQASKEHRDNMLNTNYTDIGIAVTNGKLEGKETTLVVTLYGAPHRALLAPFDNLLPLASANSPVVESAPRPTSFSILNHLPISKIINWSTIVIILLLGLFVAIYFNDHRVKIKFSLPRYRHSHSLLQALALSSAIVLIVVNISLGMVG